MKNRIFTLGVMALLFAACSVNELDLATPDAKDAEEFFATIEDASTRVFVDDDLMVLWHADDRVSIFNKYTYNQEYRFTGQTGANSGTFTKVPNDDFVTGNALSHVYAIYPYKESTAISNQGVLTIDLPATQSYAENSFGIGANTMVSCSEGNELLFKNLCGYIMLKLYGDDVKVQSISIKGNNDESLAGKATVNASVNNAPSLTFDASPTKEITLTFDTPVTLGNTAETASIFWLVVPPTTFSKGITLTVKDDKNGVFEKSTTASLQISRNTLKRLSALKVSIERHQQNNEIWYTSTDGKAVELYSVAGFGANLIKNEYSNGKGVFTFDGDITSVGNKAFYWKTTLKTVSLPDCITHIDNYAFNYCTGLESIHLPLCLQSIGYESFFGCNQLLSVLLPDGLLSIDYAAFGHCSSITTVSIPESVISIDSFVFNRCTSLSSFSGKYSSQDGKLLIINGECVAFAPASITQYSIPSTVTSIGVGAFDGCQNITSISIPNSITVLRRFAFSDCFSLTEVLLPEGLQEIGGNAFLNCSALTNVTIPKSVTKIAGYAFCHCTGLYWVKIEAVNPPRGDLKNFDDTRNCPIYVPAESVDAYKSAEYWRDYADRIQAVSSPVPVPEAIDLGLPSGVKWATFNLGASKPEEHGDYYAWGETEPYYNSLAPLTWKEGKETGYDWPSYKWSQGTETSLTKYCTDSKYGFNGYLDNKTTLELEDDAAHVQLGGKWRMPTNAELQELMNQDICTFRWVSINGVNGLKITGPNGNNIFIPVTGFICGTNISSPEDCYLCSSTLFDTYNPDYVFGYGFSSSWNMGIFDLRCYGFTIRPVCD